MNMSSGEQPSPTQPGETKPAVESHVEAQLPAEPVAPTPLDPKREQVLKKVQWRQGHESRGGRGKFGHGHGHGPTVPLRHHQVHGRGQ